MNLNSIKDYFAVSNDKNTFEQDMADSQEDAEFTGVQKKGYFSYHRKGFRQAGLSKGELSLFRSNLEQLFHRFVENSRRSEYNSDKEKLQYQLKIEELSLKNQALSEKAGKLNEEVIPDIKKRIRDIKKEISDIKENPAKASEEKVDKPGFYVSLFILFCLTIYLWVFYSSAIYSAFFREIDFTANSVFSSVFYSNAIGEAISRGFTAFLLTVFAPFIFIGLGYIVHKMMQNKGMIIYLKSAGVLFITFIFDAIIAFEISKKIYDAISANSYGETQHYRLSDAFVDVNFWMIIFAGFIVYLIWGFVFNYAYEAYESMDKVNCALHKRASLLREADSELTDSTRQIDQLKAEIAANEIEIARNREILGNTRFDRNEFKKIAFEYASGWMQFLSAAGFPQDYISETSAEVNNFIQKYSL